MEEVKQPRGRVSFGRLNVHHTSSGMKENYGLCHHLYLIPEDIDSKDAMTFGYCASRQPHVQKQGEFLLSDVDRLYVLEEKKGLTMTRLEIRLP